MKHFLTKLGCIIAAGFINALHGETYPVVDTDVRDYYSNTEIITPPAQGEPFYGQDASYNSHQPEYTDNGDGTVSDNVTGLMWQKDMGGKTPCSDAFAKADTMTLGGHSDWRVPSIKELYSLILFTGQCSGITAVKMFINTDYFDQPLGNTDIGEREIDAQTWSSTQYTGLTMNNDSTVFGVNFIDGRIKGYSKYKPGSGNSTPNTMYFRMVRGNSSYGKNGFINNNDGTITDTATGLMWQQADDGIARDWEHALAYAENLVLSGYSDWRLPNAKELQSIVDYTRCPDATNSAAIDPVFTTTSITDPDGNPGQYPYFWTGTTHLDGSNPYTPAVYIAFGKALGKMNNVIMDVHGAGAQRSDPKTGDSASFPVYSGPQGDARYVFNHVRCVRDNASANTIIHETFNRKNRTGIQLRYNHNRQIFSYSVSKPGFVTLRIYSADGALVAFVENRYLSCGSYNCKLRDNTLTSGIFIADLRNDSECSRQTIFMAR